MEGSLRGVIRAKATSRLRLRLRVQITGRLIVRVMIGAYCYGRGRDQGSGLRG